MDTESKNIEEILELTRENNKILRTIRRTQRWKSLFTFVYWTLILGSIFGVYYYFQPTIQKYMQTMKTSADLLQNIQNKAGAIPTDVQMLKNLLGK